MLLKKNLILSFAVCVISGLSFSSQAQTISTYAGTGTATFGGDSGPARTPAAGSREGAFGQTQEKVSRLVPSPSTF
jgi:hypothetical protein